jgi:DNA mismatch repair protein MutL
MAPGTEIIVEDLFHNVPARRKFLKSDASENKAVVETVQRLALSNHKVHFELIVDGKTLLNTPAESNRLARVFAILGRKVCENLYECFIDGPVAVAGFISQPAIRKRDSHGLFTFVNGRFVRDRLIMQAVSNAYATLLGRGEYPYAVIDVNVPAEEVDVNVHPTKSEVRFERPSEVFAAVSRAVRLTLSEAPWVRQELAGPAPEATGSTPPFDSLPLTQGRPPSAPPEGRGAGLWGSAEAAGNALPLDSLPLAQGRPPAPPPEGRAAGQRGSAEAARGQFGRMVYLGQFANCYLVGQTGDRLVIVDQHAAHERVMFEALKKEFEERKVASQPLLVPRLVELDPALIAAVEARQETLERLGFSVEPFGGHEVAIKSVPVLLRQRDPAPAVRAVLDELADLEDLSLATLFHKPISTMACHMAVRAGDPMEREEAVELFRLMDRVDLSAYCPHGRPVVVLFDEVEVGRWFKRT